MARPATRERLAELGFDPGQPRTPEELANQLHSDFDRVGAILKSINFKPE